MEREQRSFIMTLYEEVFHTCLFVCSMLLALFAADGAAAQAARATAVQRSYLGCFSCVSRLDVYVFIKPGIANGKWHASTHGTLENTLRTQRILGRFMCCLRNAIPIHYVYSIMSVLYSMHAGIFWMSTDAAWKPVCVHV